MSSRLSVLTLTVLLVAGIQPAFAQEAVPPPPPPPSVPPPPSSAPLPSEQPGCFFILQKTPPKLGRKDAKAKRPRKKHLSIDLSVGSLDFLKARGAYKHLAPGMMLSQHYGFELNPFVSLEPGYLLAFPKEKGNELGNVKNLFVLGFVMDLKVKMTDPDKAPWIVPYAQLGIGAYVFRGVTPLGKYSIDKSETLAKGGGFRTGGGVDMYLKRYLSLGLRVLYQGMVLSRFKCNLCGDPAFVQDKSSFQHGITAEAVLAFHIPY